MSNKEYLTIIPDMFIRWPYSLCKKCNTENLWILMVSWWYCSQRCRKCYEDDGFELPQISKKIIYLDQFAISNLMKSINKSHPSFWKDELLIWKEIFEQLDKLIYLRLIICPYSDIHEQESVLTGKTYLNTFESLRRMYQYFSHWTRFNSIFYTRHNQLYNHFKAYINKQKYVPIFSNKDVFHWDINEWWDNIFITVQSKFYENMLDDLFEERKQSHEWIKKVFNEVWKINKPDFNSQYILESKAEWKRILTNYFNSIWTYDRLERWEITVEESIWSIFWIESTLMISLYHILEKKWITDKKKHLEITIDYFLNSDLYNIPYINIHSALWSQIAYLAWKNQIWEPNRWMFNDIDIISNYLPYCDLMLVDWWLKKLLNDTNVSEKILEYNCKVFSAKKEDLEDLLKYLKDIENSVSEEHLKYVKLAYWEYNWAYESMYDKQ